MSNKKKSKRKEEYVFYFKSETSNKYNLVTFEIYNAMLYITIFWHF